MCSLGARADSSNRMGQFCDWRCDSRHGIEGVSTKNPEMLN